eukprot:SAG11_NODE_1811_length_4220_cov_3.963601_4_plen_241_part_00
MPICSCHADRRCCCRRRCCSCCRRHSEGAGVTSVAAATSRDAAFPTIVEWSCVTVGCTAHSPTRRPPPSFRPVAKESGCCPCGATTAAPTASSSASTAGSTSIAPSVEAWHDATPGAVVCMPIGSGGAAAAATAALTTPSSCCVNAIPRLVSASTLSSSGSWLPTAVSLSISPSCCSTPFCNIDTPSVSAGPNTSFDVQLARTYAYAWNTLKSQMQFDAPNPRADARVPRAAARDPQSSR